MRSVPLNVKRCLSDGRLEYIGRLAEDRDGSYFQYDDNYLSSWQQSPAPFNLHALPQTPAASA